MTDLYAEFLGEFPDYASTCALDALRAATTGGSTTEDHVYLDYTGGSLHAESQVLEHATLLNAHMSSATRTRRVLFSRR